ncbi:MAG: helix-turn-helix domain-containing protein [Prevotella sp.]|nr:helix-turn-helix domain-containing protein [Prevotella sp.]
MLVILILIGCGKKGKSPRQYADIGNTPYQEDTILLTYGTHPERALVLLDSAFLLGNIDEFHEQLCRATIYSRSLEGQRQDSALAISEALLQHDSVKNNPANLESVINLLITASRSKADDNEYLRWSLEKAALCRKQGNEVELLRTEAEIGLVLTHLGQASEGIAKLDNCIEQLDEPGSIDRMDAFVIAVKRKMDVLIDMGHYDEIPPLAQRVLDRLEHYEQHQQEYAEDSYRLSWNEHPSDRDRYLDFCRAQANGFMAIAYATMGDAQKGREHLALFDQSGYGQTFSARRMILPAQMALGLYDEAMSTYYRLAQGMGTDTMNMNYAMMLRDSAIVMRYKGHNAEAYELMRRNAQLCKLLSDSLHKSEAHNNAARYHAKEQQLMIQKVEGESQRKTILAVAIALLLVATTIVSVYYRHQRQRIAEKNRVLVRMINENSLLNVNADTSARPVRDDSAEKSADDTSLQQPDEEQQAAESDAESFETIDAIIRQERIYANANLQRQNICDRFGINRFTLNNMLFQHRGEPSLPQYINSIRLEEAVKLLRQRQDMSISAIAETVGFSPANFRKQFLRRYGMTPTEYRQNQ